MTQLIESYEELIEPSNIITHIDNFEEWLNQAECIEDLHCTLKEFEKAEMYEHCSIILEKIKNYN